jgi:hypothetical protein
MTYFNRLCIAPLRARCEVDELWERQEPALIVDAWRDVAGERHNPA